MGPRRLLGLDLVALGVGYVAYCLGVARRALARSVNNAPAQILNVVHSGARASQLHARGLHVERRSCGAALRLDALRPWLTQLEGAWLQRELVVGVAPSYTHLPY